MKKMNLLLTMAIMSFSLMAKANFQEVSPTLLKVYKEALLNAFYSVKVTCEADNNFRYPKTTSSTTGFIIHIIENADKILVNTSAISPALIVKLEKAHYSGGIFDIALQIDTTSDQTKIVGIRGETRILRRTNKGTLVAPNIVDEYVTIGTWQNCK